MYNPCINLSISLSNVSHIYILDGAAGAQDDVSSSPGGSGDVEKGLCAVCAEMVGRERGTERAREPKSERARERE